MNLSIKSIAALGIAALSIGLVGCNNASFAGPPQGSGTSSRGLEPLVGATMFTFAPEMKQVTGFAVDHWYIHPDSDSDDTFNGNPVAWGDGIDALKMATFGAFVQSVQSGQAGEPGYLEINLQFPMTMSFMCQWFFRNADNSRPRIFDIFGRELYSDSSLDISLTTAPTVEIRDPNTNQLIAVLTNSDYPNRDLRVAGTDLPLKGWTSPPVGDPSQFPQPFQTFTAAQFNRVGHIKVGAVSGGIGGGAGQGGAGSTAGGQAGGNGGLALGASIPDNDENTRVESIMSIPATNIFGQQIQVRNPVGVFADNLALRYRGAPVKQPPQVDPLAVPPRLRVSINDVDLEEALIEFSRHQAAVFTSIIGQAIGLSPSKQGTLMDPGMAVFENRYEYRFDQDDISLMANKALPGRFR
jgi:hypothetical protein